MLNFRVLIYVALFSIIFFLIQSSFAGDYVPRETDEIVVMRDGKVIGKMSRSEYKVVKIDDNPNYIPISAPRVVEFLKAKQYEESHHSIIVMGGVGRDGLYVDHSNNNFEVSQSRKPVVGGTYCYTMTKTGLCGTALSNQTYMLGIKQDFNLK